MKPVIALACLAMVISLGTLLVGSLAPVYLSSDTMMNDTEYVRANAAYFMNGVAIGLGHAVMAIVAITVLQRRFEVRLPAWAFAFGSVLSALAQVIATSTIFFSSGPPMRFVDSTGSATGPGLMEIVAFATQFFALSAAGLFLASWIILGLRALRASEPDAPQDLF